MNLRSLPLLLGLAGLLAGSGACAPEHPDLPPLPSIEVSSDDPAILEQVSAARKRVGKSPYDAAANGELGALYELYQRPEGARICYLRAATLAPDELRWAYHLGRVERAWGDLSRARPTLERAVAIDSGYTPAVVALAELEFEEGNYSESERLFQKALEQEPRSCSALLGLGRIEAERGDHESAVAHYQRALEVAPRHAPLHYSAGISRRSLGDEELALQHFEFAEANGSANPDPDPLLAEVLALELGIERDYREAGSYLRANRPAEAIPLLRKVLAADPERTGAQGYLAQALMMTGDASALAEYERAVELNPSSLEYLRSYSLLLYRSGRFAESETALREAMRLGGDHPDDHHILGAILLGQRRVSEAEAEFRAALALQPDHQEARRALAMIEQRRRGGR